ncbi:MFS transporter [Maricaulis parjimensis]|uniref:MFS transporter n=1 Tax=Maricaulis parjimensis TaxID=144023 RepID=UPI001939D455|nr:MFS transporter [Maricaulis parjimensis]
MTDTASPAGPPPLKFHTKFLYGFGSVAYGIKDLAFRVFLLYYYNLVVGAPAALVSAAIMVALIVDAISDPIVGQISDNLRTKWGRRHPLMYLSAIPAALSFFFLWFPPDGLEGTALFFYLVILASAVRTFITLYEIPSSALAPELATDYDERTTIAGYRFFFGYIGGIGLYFLALRYLFPPTAEHPFGITNPEGYVAFGIMGALIMFTTVVISTAGTHSRIKYMRNLPPPQRRNPLQTLMLMRQTFSHRGFLAILGFGVLKYTGLGISSALALYFGQYFWGLSSPQLAVLALDAALGATLALVLAPRLSKMVGKKGAAFMLALTAILFTCSPYVLRLLGLFYENGSPMLLPALFLLAAIYSMCGISSAILVHAMIGDVIDDSSLKTGRRAEGLFYSANSFMQKCSSGLGVFVAGLMLSAVGMPDNARHVGVEPEVILHLVQLYIPVIAALYLVGSFFLRFYKIDRASHEANLASIRAKEAAELTESNSV